MIIGIGLKENSYTPEAYAYERYLNKNNLQVELCLEKNLDPNNDLNLYFMGLDPFWIKKTGKASIIHEYSSLSIPPYAKTKNYIKKLVNRKPSARIFLNSTVKNNLSLKDNVPYIFRDMGIDNDLFQEPSKNPDFDIVYCGSIAGRPGLIEEINRLASLDLTILVVGHVSKQEKSFFNSSKNIQFTGRVERNELASLYKKAKAGLNYTPNIYPFNIQTSTKTLEYLAAGLGVISNKYFWSNNFFVDKKNSVIWLDKLQSKNNFMDFSFEKQDMSRFHWDSILKQSKFIELIKNI